MFMHIFFSLSENTYGFKFMANFILDTHGLKAGGLGPHFYKHYYCNQKSIYLDLVSE